MDIMSEDVMGVNNTTITNRDIGQKIHPET